MAISHFEDLRPKFYTRICTICITFKRVCVFIWTKNKLLSLSNLETYFPVYAEQFHDLLLYLIGSTLPNIPCDNLSVLHSPEIKSKRQKKCVIVSVSGRHCCVTNSEWFTNVIVVAYTAQCCMWTIKLWSLFQNSKHLSILKFLHNWARVGITKWLVIERSYNIILIFLYPGNKFNWKAWVFSKTLLCGFLD